MFRLYNLGLIPIDKIVDYMGTDGVIELYKDGKLKHEDAKRMYDSKVLTVDSLVKLLSTQDMEDDEKLVLIYSAFSEDKYTELRNLLIETISKIQIKNVSTQSRKSNNPNPNPNPNPIATSNRYVTDPCARWNLMANFDPNYTVEYCKRDGHAIIHLPSLDKHIIEKIFEKDSKSGTHKWAYGRATYIIDDLIYSEHKDDIVLRDDDEKTEAIDRNILVKLGKEKEGVEKIVHSGWGKKMCEAFDIDTESLYSQEQREEINKLAEQVEKSKKMILE